jgi:2-haloacid dehalogenase
VRLSDFKVLTLDFYGTLIDWETGIWTALQPLLARTGGVTSREEALAAFARHETAQEAATPRMLYSEVLACVHRRLAAEWGGAPDDEQAAAFGHSVGNWPAFADSSVALAYLHRFYKLAILSNVDRASFAASNQRLETVFDAVFSAEDIGSYKPDLHNFRHLIAALGRAGHPPGDILHTAQSLFHDHAPANACGLASAWIDRRHEQSGWGATMPPGTGVRYDFRFASLAEMAAAHRAEQAG